MPAGPEAAIADPSTGNRTVVCVRCGGAARLGRLWCDACSGERANGPFHRLATRPTNATQFSIESLLLVTTLAAICLGIFVANPVLGLVASAWAVGALARTVVVGRHYGRQGLAFEMHEKIGSFVMSLGVVLGAIVAVIAVSMVVAELGAIIGDTYSGYGLHRGPLGEFTRQVLGCIYVPCVIAAPLMAGSGFLWLTRPR